MSHNVSFMHRGPISPRLHGTLDYLLAAALIAGPFALGFDDGVATGLVLALGAAATLLAVGTAWSRGIVRVLPPPLHGIADIGATVVLIAAPFALGFTEDSAATIFCAVAGAGGLLATLLTRFESDLGAPPRPARARMST